MNEDRPEIPQAVLDQLGALQRTYGQKMLPDEDYFKHFYDALDQAKKEVESHKEASHVFLLWGRNRDDTVEGDDKWHMTICMMAGWPPEHKYKAMMGLGVKWAEDNPGYMLMQIVHVSEGWIAEYPPQQHHDGPYLPEGTPTPSERPDRVEVLMASSMSMDQRFSYQNTEIVRRQNSGKFRRWGRTWDHIYDPKAPTANPREAQDWLALHILMGYFKASEVNGVYDKN